MELGLLRKVTAAERQALTRIAFVAIFVLCSNRADATIEEFGLSKRIYYRQTSDSPPSSPLSIDGGPFIRISGSNNFTAARVFSTSQTALSPISPIALTPFSSTFWGAGKGYATVAELDVDLPPGDIFGYLVEGGALPDRMALLQLPSTNLFATSIPNFTGNAFSGLNGMNAAADKSITWNSFNHQFGVNERAIFFSISRVSDGNLTFFRTLSQSTTSVVVPANTLAASTLYDAEIYFNSRVRAIDVGFSGADTGITFDLVTRLQFTTASAGAGADVVPEPLGFALLFCVLFIATVFRPRRRRQFVACVCVVASIASIAEARAAIDIYAIGKRQFFVQTSDAQPTSAIAFDGGMQILAGSPGNLASARVFSTRNTNPSPSSPFTLTQVSPGNWSLNKVYATQAAVDLDLPLGDTFGYTIDGGDLGGQLALLPIPAGNRFPNQVPYFTNSAFTQLNGLDAHAPFTVTWNGFFPPGGINDTPLFFNIYRVSDGMQAAGTQGNNTLTSFNLPANTLAPDTLYRAQLYYSCRILTPNAGFTSATRYINYDYATSLDFTTAAFLAGDYNRNAVVDQADYVLWRKTLGTTDVVPFSGADGDGDGKILPADYGVWRANFGAMGSASGLQSSAVPEPSTPVIAVLGLMVLAARVRLRHGH
jgi:hypothetical protein